VNVSLWKGLSIALLPQFGHVFSITASIMVVVVVVTVLCYNVYGSVGFIYDKCYICHHHHHCSHVCDRQM
jgi:hypothetical protein